MSGSKKREKEKDMPRNKMFLMISIGVIVILLSVPPCCFAKKVKKQSSTPSSEEFPTGPTKTDAKVISGTISSISKKYIFIEFEQTATSSKEIVVPYDQFTNVSGAGQNKTVTDLKIGDTVTIQYEETYVEGKDQKRKKIQASCQTD